MQIPNNIFNCFKTREMMQKRRNSNLYFLSLCVCVRFCECGQTSTATKYNVTEKPLVNEINIKLT